jgi:ubiquinone/menaquinone biosynthesis C-methylase UbiE
MILKEPYIRSEEEWLRIINKMPVAGPGIRGKDYLTSPIKDWEVFKPYFNLLEDEIILDVGCGHGRMAQNFINTKIKYLGVDVIAEMIDWNWAAYKSWDNIKFYYRSFYNSMYNPTDKTCNFKLPLADKSVKGILALSLTTHLETVVTIYHYLREFERVLCDCGTMVVTWFLSLPNAVCTSAERTVIRRWDLYYILDKLKLKIVAEWGGQTTNWHDQCVTILRHI